MSRALTGAALLLALALPSCAGTAHPDPWFTKLSFAQWLSEGERHDIPWSADILPAEISPHQRLMLRVVIRLYGSELEKRRGAGEFLTLVQYTDSAGRLWQHHTSLDLARLPAGTGLRQLAIAQYAYVLPGDYSLAIAVCDTATLEHGVITRQVHIAPPVADPLPDAWANLAAVDFIPSITEPPDVWYLPGIEGRLNLPVTTRRPVHIHLLVNITPSWDVSGSIAALHRNMNAVIPVMKALSQIDVRNGSLDTALLDLTNLRIASDQNWDSMRKVFLDSKPGIVDVRSLANHRKMTVFFHDEIIRRLLADWTGDPDAPTPVVIVLSGPAFLGEQDTTPPFKPPFDLNYRLFYIRWASPGSPADDLQRALEPLNARFFNVASNEQVRETIAAILADLSKL